MAGSITSMLVGQTVFTIAANKIIVKALNRYTRWPDIIKDVSENLAMDPSTKGIFITTSLLVTLVAGLGGVAGGFGASYLFMLIFHPTSIQTEKVENVLNHLKLTEDKLARLRVMYYGLRYLDPSLLIGRSPSSKTLIAIEKKWWNIYDIVRVYPLLLQEYNNEETKEILLNDIVTSIDILIKSVLEFRDLQDSQKRNNTYGLNLPGLKLLLEEKIEKELEKYPLLDTPDLNLFALWQGDSKNPAIAKESIAIKVLTGIGRNHLLESIGDESSQVRTEFMESLGRLHRYYPRLISAVRLYLIIHEVDNPYSWIPKVDSDNVALCPTTKRMKDQACDQLVPGLREYVEANEPDNKKYRQLALLIHPDKVNNDPKNPLYPYKHCDLSAHCLGRVKNITKE